MFHGIIVLVISVCAQKCSLDDSPKDAFCDTLIGGGNSSMEQRLLSK